MEKMKFLVLGTNSNHCTLTHFINKGTIYKLWLNIVTPVEFSSLSIQVTITREGGGEERHRKQVGGGMKGEGR